MKYTEFLNCTDFGVSYTETNLAKDGLNVNNRPYCSDCYYRMKITGGYACHYSIIEDALRPCPSDACTVKLVLSEEDAREKSLGRKLKIFREKA